MSRRAPQPAPVRAAAKPEPAPAPFPPPVAAKIEAPLPAQVTAGKPDGRAALSFARAAKAEPAAAPVARRHASRQQSPPLPAARASAPAAKPQHRSGWIIQVGAFPARAGGQAASRVRADARRRSCSPRPKPFTEPVDKGGTTLYRARFAGLDKDQAEAACKYLKRNDVECVTVKN